MKITDMNLICLEECFEYLEFQDLLNVADANTRLRKAAQFIYLRKYSEKLLKLSIQDIRRGNIQPDDDRENLYVRDLKTSLKLLRCFGPLIKYVNFWFNSNSSVKNIQQLGLIYLNKYCAESLIKIKFEGAGEDILDSLTKPFTKVEKVQIYQSYLNKSDWLKRIFPKLKHFKCQSSNQKHITQNISCLMDNFSHLEVFDLHSFIPYLQDSTKDQMVEILRLNPQLKELHLFLSKNDNEPFFDFETFRNLIELMQNLDTLTLCRNVALFSNFTGTKIHLNNIKRFKTCGDNLNLFPFFFDQLEFFEFNLYEEELTVDFYNFIEQHPTIRKICVKNLNNILQGSNINLALLKEATTPLLTEIEFYYFHSVSVDDILCLVSSFKLLKKIFLVTFQCKNIYLNELRERLGCEWRITLKRRNYLHIERIDHPMST